MASGDRLYASDSPRLVARARRITSTATFTTTETGILRIDDVPIRAGRLYEISTSPINLDTTVSNDIAAARFRIVTGASPGGVATTSSTQISQGRNTIDDSVQSNLFVMQAYYAPGTDGYLSVLLSALRISGTGNIQFFANSTELFDMIVMDLGPDPGDTGVII